MVFHHAEPAANASYPWKRSIKYAEGRKIVAIDDEHVVTRVSEFLG